MTELTERKRQILKIVVESYIDTAEPIGSKAIVERMPGKISSATVRNELADLVEMGYLEQPHTSAGRIPSPKGYRLYVNELMERRALSAEETEKINQTLSGRMAGMDEVISQAGQMVSRLVGYPAYTVADRKSAVTAGRFELIPVDENSFIAVVMLSDSQVKSRLMGLELPVEQSQLPELSHLLNTHFTRIGAAEMNAHLMSLSDQVDGNWFLLLNRVVEYAGALVRESEQQQVFTNGASQILKFPEYRDVDKAHDLMSFMVDNKENLPVPAGDAPMQILIGPENVNDALKESSVIVASYDIGDNMRGLVGVVGPTRMDYATVAARLSYFAESLSAMFGKKNQLPPKEEQE
ncbi:MAG: heat-inducible transcription repressor HrcA [Ruminococcaceae bacterium]|jgi:heat-inducible transcriptional repressor|nr:heat-inducible transcription repressor HrcA [Oscillospiraceae bacterium]